MRNIQIWGSKGTKISIFFLNCKINYLIKFFSLLSDIFILLLQKVTKSIIYALDDVAERTPHPRLID